MPALRTRKRPPFRALVAAAVAAVVSMASAQDVTVRPGDSLWALAKRHNTTVADLIETNGLTTSQLTPGDTLRLPEGSIAHPETYTVETGDTLYDIAIAAGLTVDELIAINDLDGSVIRPGQVLQLGAGATPPEPLVVTVRPGDTLWDLARDNGTTVAAIESANGLGATGAIRPGDTLVIPGRYAGTSADQGGPASTTITVAPGDSLWSVARRYNTTVAALMSANGLARETLFTGQTLKIVTGKELVRAAPAGAEPAPTSASAMLWPVVGEITSRFGYRRLDIGGSNMHYGLDIDGRTGDPIHAAVAGVVTHADWLGGYGLCVIVRSGDTEYYYGHASELLVRVGDEVAMGQALARVGSTGRSTGSHLHFEIRVDGTPVDPLPILSRQANH